MSGKNTQSDYELLYPEDTDFTGTAYDVFIEHRYGNWEDDDSWWEPGEAICVDGRYPVFATYEDAARYASTLTPAVLGDIFSEEGEELTTLTVVLEECHFTDGEMRDGVLTRLVIRATKDATVQVLNDLSHLRGTVTPDKDGKITLRAGETATFEK